MKKFRKKPVVIEAIQWTGNNYEEIQQFSKGKVTYYEWFQHNERGVNPKMLQIPTLEGKMEASIGDWVIKGIQSEYYPCKPDIFEKTYELVED